MIFGLGRTCKTVMRVRSEDANMGRGMLGERIDTRVGMMGYFKMASRISGDPTFG